MYIVTDTHRGNPASEKTAFQQILYRCSKDNDTLLCTGDIFDFFLRSWTELLIDNYVTLGLFLSLTEHYVIGNHDIDLKPLDALDRVKRPVDLNGFDVKFHYPSLTMEVDGTKWLVTHGHLYGLFGWMFRLLDNELVERPPMIRKISRWLVRGSLLHKASMSQVYNNSIRNSLVKEAKRIGAEVVVFGHTHQQQIIEQDGIVVLNAGDGMRGEYAVYDNGKFILRNVA